MHEKRLLSINKFQKSPSDTIIDDGTYNLIFIFCCY